MIIIAIVGIITTIKMNIMALFWKNTHSLKFNTAPAFTNKVLQNTDTKPYQAVIYYLG